MEISAARRLMVVRRMQFFHRKHEVAIAKLTNPKVCLHTGPFLRFREACQHFCGAQAPLPGKKSKRTSDDPAVLRTELVDSITFYRTLLRKSLENIKKGVIFYRTTQSLTSSQTTTEH